MGYGLLEDKVIAVTGAASGIGLAAAEAYVEEGAKVVLADINDAPGKQAADRLGESAIYTHTDVTREADVADLVATAAQHFGRLDVMHNNAGAASDQSPILDIGTDGMRATFDLNAASVLWGHKYAARQFTAQGTPGNIVTTASVASLAGGWSTTAYTISKHAVIGIVRQAARELGALNIRSNAICPGLILTPIMASTLGLPPEQSDEFIDFVSGRMANDQPIGRCGTPEDIARVAVFLASDLSGFMTGTIIPVDGGATAVNLGQARDHALQAGLDFLNGVR